MNAYPLKFKPVYKDYPWGNRRLPAMFDRNEPDDIYAESWEISTHPDGESVVVNGDLEGKTLSEVLAVSGKDVLGSKVEGNDFPLLIKLIDAAKPLSVQVHPNNGNAEEVQGEPKTEMWYFLNDEPSQIYCGLKPGTTRDDFIKAIEEESFEEILRMVPAEKGGAAFVPGGRVHAIDAGCLILEIQQNSNTTYRIYDWDRMGNDGKPRELHIDQALDVINWEDTDHPLVEPKLLVDTETFQCLEVLSCEYFKLEKLIFSAPLEVPMSGKTFHALFVAEGEAELHWGDEGLAAPAGTSVLIPAAMPSYTLSGNATVLRITIP